MLPKSSRMSVRKANADLLNYHPLYSHHCRRAVPWVLGIIAIGVFAILIGLSVILTFEAGWDGSLHAFLQFLAWFVCPLIAWFTILAHCVLRWRRTLRPTNIVVSSSLVLFLWLVYLVLGITIKWGIYFNVYMAMCAFVLNIPYLVYGSIALHREKKMKRAGLPRAWDPDAFQPENQIHDLPQSSRDYDVGLERAQDNHRVSSSSNTGSGDNKSRKLSSVHEEASFVSTLPPSKPSTLNGTSVASNRPPSYHTYA